MSIGPIFLGHPLLTLGSIPGTSTAWLWVAFGIGCVAVLLGFRLRGGAVSEESEAAGAVRRDVWTLWRRQMGRYVTAMVFVCGLMFLLPGELWVQAGRSGVAALGAVGVAVVAWCGCSAVRVAAVQGSIAGQELGVTRAAVRVGGALALVAMGLSIVSIAGIVLWYGVFAPVIVVGFGVSVAVGSGFFAVGGGLAANSSSGVSDSWLADSGDSGNAGAIRSATVAGAVVARGAGVGVGVFAALSVLLVASLVVGQLVFRGVGLVLPLLVAVAGVFAVGAGVSVSLAFGQRRVGAMMVRGFVVGAVLAAGVGTLLAFSVLPGRLSALAWSEFGVDGLGAIDPRLVVTGAVVVGAVLAIALVRPLSVAARPVTTVPREPGSAALSGVMNVGAGLRGAAVMVVAVGAAVMAAVWLGTGSSTLSLLLVALMGVGFVNAAALVMTWSVVSAVQAVAVVAQGVSSDDESVVQDRPVALVAVGVSSSLLAVAGTLGACAVAGALVESALFAARSLGVGGTAFAVLTGTVMWQVLAGFLVGVVAVLSVLGVALGSAHRAAQSVAARAGRQVKLESASSVVPVEAKDSRMVNVCSRGAWRVLFLPLVAMVAVPVAVGFGVGVPALLGCVAGAAVMSLVTGAAGAAASVNAAVCEHPGSVRGGGVTSLVTGASWAPGGVWCGVVSSASFASALVASSVALVCVPSVVLLLGVPGVGQRLAWWACAGAAGVAVLVWGLGVRRYRPLGGVVSVEVADGTAAQDGTVDQDGAAVQDGALAPQAVSVVASSAEAVPVQRVPREKPRPVVLADLSQPHGRVKPPIDLREEANLNLPKATPGQQARIEQTHVTGSASSLIDTRPFEPVDLRDSAAVGSQEVAPDGGESDGAAAGAQVQPANRDDVLFPLSEDPK